MLYFLQHFRDWLLLRLLCYNTPMSACHCGLKGHLKKFRAKKLGALGVVLMGLHILWHAVECLVLPAVLVALGGQAVADDAEAASVDTHVEADMAPESTETSESEQCWLLQAEIMLPAWRQADYSEQVFWLDAC